MKTTEHRSQSAFDNAQMLAEGSFTTPQGNVVHTYYVDLAGDLLAERLCLVKVSEPQFDLRTADSVRLSRPSVFRKTGEVLVKDEQEGRVRTSTTETLEDPTRETAQMDRRERAINAGLRLSHANLSVSGSATTKRTNTDTSAWTFGKDWLIYCTSLPPETGEEDTWRRTFPENYTNVARIHRPTQFAQALGLAVCEHIGATGKPAPMKGTFHGFKTSEVHRAVQIVLHGPVLYVDDPYRFIDDADTGWATICSMIFAKSSEYAAQKEYRFAMLSIPPEAGQVVDLPVSGMLRDCLEPVKTPHGLANAPVTIARDEREPGTQHETSRGYTYRRRRVRRESGNWKNAEPGSDRAREEIVEETVTSPEEVPKPFPEEPKQPDVIVFERVGGQIRFAHTIYREEETTNWRIETLATNPTIVADSDPRSLPRVLEVSQEDQLESLAQPPTDPRFVLELCLNPSLPRPPRPYNGLSRCTQAEVEHTLGCLALLGRSGGHARRRGSGTGSGVGVVGCRVHCGSGKLVRTDREERVRHPRVCGGRGIRARAAFRSCGLGDVFRNRNLHTLRAPAERTGGRFRRPLASRTDESRQLHGRIAEAWVAPQDAQLPLVKGATSVVSET